MKNKRRIMIPYGVRTKLVKETGASTSTVWYSLRGMSDTPLANLIRKRALEMGGVYCR